MATKTVSHGQANCPIGNRSIHKEDRSPGLDCPFCGVQLPAKNRFLLVTVDDDGTVISSELAPKPPIWKRTPVILGVVLAVVFVGMSIVSGLTGDSSGSGSGSDSNTDSASSSFSGRVLGYEPRNPASLAIELEVTNNGSATGRWECTVRAQDDSLTYKGFDIFSTDTPLAPGKSYTGVGTITITNEGASYVTKVWVDECSSQ